jgi:hypothetical protein
VCHLTADVNRELLLADRVEILRVAFPIPGDAFGERRAGNVFDTLHQLDQPLFPAGDDRGEADAAVAGDHRRHAVATGRLQQAVPADLAVVVGVDVDEAGSDDAIRRVDRLYGTTAEPGIVDAATATHLHDPAVFDADIGCIAVGASSVDDGAADDLQVEHGQLLTWWPRYRHNLSTMPPS